MTEMILTLPPTIPEPKKWTYQDYLDLLDGGRRPIPSLATATSNKFLLFA